MKKIYIIGNGGLAKEVCFLIEEINRNSLSYDFSGFIAHGNSTDFILIGSKKYPVFDENNFIADPVNKSALIVIGIGDPQIIAKIAKRFNNFQSVNLIHPNVIFSTDSVQMGTGNIICNNCTLTVDISIGSFNIFNVGAFVGHDTIIGNCNAFMPRTQVSGSVQMGDQNFVGMNASLLQGISIGNNNKIGAHSFVMNSIPDNSCVIGTPAKITKQLDVEQSHE